MLITKDVTVSKSHRMISSWHQVHNYSTVNKRKEDKKINAMDIYETDGKLT